MTAWRARADAGVVAAPKPGLSGSSITSAPHAAACAGPSSLDPVSTTTSCGRSARWASIDAQQRAQLGGGVVQDDDHGEGHGARP